MSTAIASNFYINILFISALFLKHCGAQNNIKHLSKIFYYDFLIISTVTVDSPSFLEKMSLFSMTNLGIT